MVTALSMYIHITHHTSSQWHFQHQQHLISMSLSTSTSSHLNVILNINIFSSQCHSQHQHHLISMTLSTTTTSSHINIIINNNIISYQYYHKHQHRLVSITTNIIFNNNIILLQYHKHQRHLISINIINNNIISKSHSAYTYIYSSCLRFTLSRSSNNTSLIKIIMSFINNRCTTSH